MRFFRPIAGLTGWQRFGFEVAIIVIGVGLAMLADQLITNANRKAETRQAMQAVNSDLLFILFYTSERMAIEPCRHEQVERLVARLDEDGEDWQAEAANFVNAPVNPMVLPQVLRTPIRNWPDGAWKALLASDIAVYIDRDRFIELSGIFDVAREVRDLQTEALAIKGELAYLASPGMLEPAERRAAHAKIGRLSALEGLITIHAGQSGDRVFRLEIDFSEMSDDAPDILEAIEAIAVLARETYGDCTDVSQFDRLKALFEDGEAP